MQNKDGVPGICYTPTRSEQLCNIVKATRKEVEGREKARGGNVTRLIGFNNFV